MCTEKCTHTQRKGQLVIEVFDQVYQPHVECDSETAINILNSTGMCIAASQFLRLGMLQVSNLELSCENQQGYL